jgi:hypothetical protein
MEYHLKLMLYRKADEWMYIEAERGIYPIYKSVDPREVPGVSSLYFIR